MTRRTAILAHLTRHPDLTASELARAIGSGPGARLLLQDMEAKAQVISRTGRRPGQSREVRLWQIAPPGTVTPPRAVPPAEVLARKRERDRRNTAARRARARARARVPFPGPALLTAGACVGADPALFFPEPGDTETEARAMAICAACPVPAACYERALLNRERAGIWGGVNFERADRSAAVTA